MGQNSATTTNTTSAAPTPIVGDATAGQQKITTCAACHGTDGNSPIAVNPNLAGQHAEYIAAALHEYQNGKRNNPIMAGMSAGLSIKISPILLLIMLVKQKKWAKRIQI